MKTQRARSCFLLFIGILLLSLSACTPGPYHYNVVEKISIDKDIVYVRASQECNFCEDVGGLVYYASRDNGQIWEEITSPAEDVTRNLTGESKGRSVQCLSPDLQTCYRINKEEHVEISYDGGIVWQVDWQIPDGRKYYMQRLSPYPELDTVPYDLQIMESNAGYYIIVAMGNQGVLVKSPDGNWDRFAVGLAAPTPYQAANFSEANGVLAYSELLSAFAIAFAGFVLLSFVIWTTIYFNSDRTLRKGVKRWFLLFLLSLVFLFAFSLLASSPQTMDKLFGNYRGFYNGIILIFALGFRLVYVLPLMIYLFGWIVVTSISINKIFNALSFFLDIVFSVILFFGVLFPFQLWALGIITVYETAQLYAWIAGAAALLIACFVEFRIALLSVKQVNK